MGCFATCFGTCKPSRRRRRRQRQPIKASPSLLDHLQKYQSIDDFNVPQLDEEQEEQNAEIPSDLSLDTNDQKEEKANVSERKKVTFDMNVKFYEDLRREEEEAEEGEISEEETVEETKRKDRKAKATGECQCGSDSSSSSLFSYPPNHRYQNCRDSDDEFDEILASDESESDLEYYTDEDDYEDDDDDGCCEVESAVKDGDKTVMGQEQSSESLFSLSVDSRKHKLGPEVGDKEVNSPLVTKDAPRNESNSRYDQRKYTDSVLNPVENLSQWKVMKAKSKMASRGQAKENRDSAQDFSFPVKKESLEKDVAVDTSLSTWLPGSERTPTRNNSRNSSVSVGNSPSDRKSVSPNKFEDRPILGALTLEEIRQMSAASTPRKSPSRSPDDTPIIGSVGSYWSHTGQTTKSGSSAESTKSKFRESAEVIWDSTPFETRLEKALEKEANAEEILAV